MCVSVLSLSVCVCLSVSISDFVCLCENVRQCVYEMVPGCVSLSVNVFDCACVSLCVCVSMPDCKCEVLVFWPLNI